MLNDEIKAFIRQEIASHLSDKRFGLTPIPRHVHNGIDTPKISGDNIIPSINVSGSISFAQQTTYTLNLNSSFTPTFIYAYGNVTGDTTQRFVTFGTASLRPAFFFQPLTNTSVYTGSVQYPTFDNNVGAVVPLQSSVYYGSVSDGGARHTLASEGHLVRIFYSSTVFASATVTSFSKSAITIDVDTLVSGWTINANIVVI